MVCCVQSMVQLVAKSAEAEKRESHVQPDWPLKMKWSFAPDHRPTQPNSTAVAERSPCFLVGSLVGT